MKYLHFALRFALYYGMAFLVFVALDVLFGDPIDWIHDLVAPVAVLVGVFLIRRLEKLHDKLNK